MVPALFRFESEGPLQRVVGNVGRERQPVRRRQHRVGPGSFARVTAFDVEFDVAGNEFPLIADRRDFNLEADLAGFVEFGPVLTVEQDLTQGLVEGDRDTAPVDLGDMRETQSDVRLIRHDWFSKRE